MPALENPKHELFCDLMLLENDVQKAYNGAGYKGKNASKSGWILMQRPDIKARLSEQMGERSERLEISADRVMKEFGNIAFKSDVTQILDVDKNGNVHFHGKLSDLPPEIRMCIQEVKQTEHGTTIKMYSRIDALNSLAKILKLFTDTVQPIVNIVNMGDVTMAKDASGEMVTIDGQAVDLNATEKLEFIVGSPVNEEDRPK